MLLRRVLGSTVPVLGRRVTPSISVRALAGVTLPHGGCATPFDGWMARCMSTTSTESTDEDGKRVVEAEVVGEPEGPAPASPEVVVGEGETHTFQAETRQLLDIVANSLYTDRHVFIREILSNASDALEKVRHGQVADEAVADPGKPLEVHITTDETANTITFSDAGVGMSKSELVENIGTIARSGSKAFVQKLKEGGPSSSDATNNIIGQFGVGFYSAFMVGDNITVYSKSADPEAPANRWQSSGDGAYEIAAAEGVTRGTKIVVELKESAKEFSNAKTVEDIITKHSNFINFPIYLNGKQVNTVQAIWTMSKSDITEEMYTGFYKFKAKAFDEPLYRLHFQSDMPLELHALFFVGEQHNEKYGLGRQAPGVDLYSRKVLIEPETGVLPDWLRFVHGIVDSSDIPLNISRESMQDTALMRRIRSVLTRRLLRFFDAESKKDKAKYEKFFLEFGHFLKEGVCSEHAFQQEIAKLLRFESSALPAGELTSMDDYISRSKPGINKIYYLSAPSRKLADASPYMEAFKKPAGEEADETEVLYLYNSLDDFVMNTLNEYSSRKLVTAEVAELGLGDDDEDGQGDDDKADAADGDDAEKSKKSKKTTDGGLTDSQAKDFGEWLMNSALPKRLSKVKPTRRLVTSPAVVTDHESAALRRMMRMLNQQGRDVNSPRAEDEMLPKQTLEINPSHPIIVQLNALRSSNPPVAITVAEQLFDNALIAAGLLDDSRTMLPRLNKLLELVSGGGKGSAAASAAPADDSAVPDAPASSRDEQVKDFQDFMAGAVDEALKTGVPPKASK